MNIILKNNNKHMQSIAILIPLLVLALVAGCVQNQVSEPNTIYPEEFIILALDRSVAIQESSLNLYHKNRFDVSNPLKICDDGANKVVSFVNQRNEILIECIIEVPISVSQDCDQIKNDMCRNVVGAFIYVDDPIYGKVLYNHVYTELERIDK